MNKIDKKIKRDNWLAIARIAAKFRAFRHEGDSISRASLLCGWYRTSVSRQLRLVFESEL